MKEKSGERVYPILAAIIILVVYAASYFLSEEHSPVYHTMIVVGFVFIFLILFLIAVSISELFLERRLNVLNNILTYSFVDLIGESIALIFSFFFYLSLMTTFNIIDNSLVFFQPISYILLTGFSHVHHGNKKAVGVFAILGTIFLCIGLVSFLSRFFFIFIALSLLFFSTVSYSVFRVEVKEEIRSKLEWLKDPKLIKKKWKSIISNS